MKSTRITLSKITVLLLLCLASNITLDAQVAINTSGSTPDGSAMLDVAATDKGFLVPRLTLVQRNAISFPATGLLIYQKTGAQGFYYYNGSTWLPLLGGNGAFASVSGLTTSIQPNDDFLFGAAAIDYATGTENKFFLHQATGAFRAGRADGSNWNISSLGDYSFAGGLRTQASGDGATAFGGGSAAIGDYSFAAGDFAKAYSDHSISLGDNTEAWGENSVVLGKYGYASGTASMATNYNCRAEGDYSTAIGRNAFAKAFIEIALGSYNTIPLVTSTTTWDGNDRILVVGNGIANMSRSDAFSVFKDGRVAVGNIGHHSVIKGKLHVEGGINTFLANYAYLNNLGDVNTISNQTNSYSIYATDRIACSEFNAFSDARIKRVIRQSDAVQDLETLANLRITDYKMIDQLAHGNKTYKKVIAQEVAEVYPEAVSKGKEHIPNIFKRSRVENGWIALATDLKTGDYVKIITADKKHYLEVLKAEKHRFQVALDDVENVFVYGKEVDDFHSVDYDALTTLNISATQALLERVEVLEKENAELKARQMQYKNLSAEVEAIKAILKPTE